MSEDSTRPDRKRQRCAGCSALSAEATTNYTLISAKHAWRLTLAVNAQGEKEAVWYCPRCWKKNHRNSVA